MAGAQIVYSTFGRIPTNNTVYFAKKKNQDLPPVAVVKVGEKYFLATFTKKVFLTGASKLLATKQRSAADAKRVEAMPECKAYLLIFRKQDLASVLRELPKLDGLTLKGPITYDQLHNTLVVKNNFPDELVNRALGNNDEDGEVKTPVKPTAKFGNAHVYMPDNIQPSRKKNILELLAATKKALAAKGLDYLITTGNIKITNLGGKTAGHYVIGTEDIAIDSKGSKLTSGVSTILHELGHKLYYRKMTTKEHALIKKIYDTNLKDDIIDVDRLTKISTRYIGKDKAINNKYDYVLVQQAGAWYALPVNLVSGKLQIINTQKASGPYATPQALAKDFALPLKSKWFPNEYSRSDDKEFFSELFADWLEGRLEKLPAAWIDRVTKPYQK